MSPSTQLVGASHSNVISLSQVTEDLCQLSVHLARLDIHPLRAATPDTYDEDSFCGSGHSGCWNEKSGLRSTDRPKHFRKHARSQTSVRIRYVQLYGHRSCFHLHRMSNPRNFSGESLVRKSRYTELDISSFLHTGHILFGYRNKE